MCAEKRSARSKSSQPVSGHNPDKAEAILAGALEVFTNYGYRGASMDRIATAAGVSKPTLYQYFENKEGLFVAIVQQLTQNSRQVLINLPEDPSQQPHPEKVLRHIATSFLETSAQNKALLTLMRLMIGESEQFPELAQTFVRDIPKPLLEQLANYLASQPYLEFSDPMVAARIFAGSLVYYLIIQNVMNGQDVLPLDTDRMVNGLVELMTARK